MLRAIDGFDWGSVASIYPENTLRLKYVAGSKPGSLQPSPGRFGGNAGRMGLIGTYFPECSWDFDAQPKWYISFALKPITFFSALGWGDGQMLRLDSTTLGGPIFSLAIDAFGQLRCYTGGDGGADRGSLIGIAPVVLPVGTWASIDLVVDVSGRLVEVWINDARQLHITNVVWANGPTRYADRFTWMWRPNRNNTGYDVDDFAIADGQGSLNNGRLGPGRVVLARPRADATHPQWTRSPNNSDGHPATADYQCVNDQNAVVGFPDGDHSYLEPGAPSMVDLFQLTSTPCFGRNMGIALNAVLKGASLPATLELVVRANPSTATITAIGGTVGGILPYTFTSSYVCRQNVSETAVARPGQPWTDGDLANGWWGIRSAVGTPRVTTVFLEKFTTLRPVSYDCGGLGSYAF